MKRTIALCACLALVTSLTGCGGGPDDAPDLVPVSGTVKIDGVPTAGVSVQFIPAAGVNDDNSTTAGGSWTGTTDKEGKFTLMNRRGEKGCPPGNYKVVFSKFAMADGSAIPEGEDPITAGAKEIIPPAFSDETQTHEKAEVPEGGTDKLEFQITLK